MGDPDLWSEDHTAAETDGGWTQNHFKGTHVIKLEARTSVPPDADPIPEEPVTGACTAPIPPPLARFGVHCTDIRGNWEKCDVTPLTAEGNRAYCDSVGFVNRNSCPARAEAPAWTRGDRLLCERYMIGADAPVFVWTGSEADGGLWAGNENGFTFEHRKGSAGSLKVCNADGSVCTAIF